ncbi:MAG TPA: alpha/beta fold hydrolase [Anaerolineales bacterium]|nr:alpha/beta fold hydrolase [Anaerolineales bacterium]
MSRRKKSVNTAVIVAVLLVLFMGARAKQDDELTYAGSQLEGATYSERGPYTVGVRDLIIQGKRPLEISLWYPAANGEGGEEVTQYPYEIKMAKPIGKFAVATFAGRALRDVSPDLSDVPYPLVILSPGFSLGSFAYAWLAEHLASYGFVVIAPEHQEHLDPANELWRSAIERPQDVLSVLAYVDEQTADGGVFDGLINAERIAVIGHSYGGYTSLASAGARINTPAFKSHCEEASASNHPAAWLCNEILPHLDDMADLAGLDETPNGLWPAWTDSRIVAIVPMAGDAFFFGQEGLAEINIPVMAIGGTKDNDAPYEWGTLPAFEHASSPRKVLISLTDAEHMIFTNPCEKIPFYLKLFSREFCHDTDWDRKYAHELVSHFTAAFLLAELKQDLAASQALAPNNIELPGMKYEAQGY